METSSKRKSILIVEDQDNWRELLTEILVDEFEVMAVSNFRDAISVINNRLIPFHVLVTDMRLEDSEPGNEDGLRLIAEVNKFLDKSTNTIVITGYSTVDSAVRALGKDCLNAFAYREKCPEIGKFNYDEFIELVREAACCAEEDRSRMLFDIDVFVLMPFHPDFDETYKLIQEVSNELGLKCKRSDYVPVPDAIMEQVEDCIERSRVVVADITNKNLNVYFELGISDAKAKPRILLAQNERDLSNLLQGNRVIFYSDTLKGSRRLRKDLKEQIQYLMDRDDFFQRTSTIFKEKNSCLMVTSENMLGRDIYNSIIQPVLSKLAISSQFAWDVLKRNTIKDISKAIMGCINSSELIIADLTGKDEDVFYMGGFAFGLDRYPIFLVDNREEIPFDIKAVGKILYSKETEDEREKLKRELTKTIETFKTANDTSSFSEKKKEVMDNILDDGKKGEPMDKVARVQVFINHASEDKALVRSLYTELRKVEWLDPWLDEEKLLPGQDWEFEINKALNGSDAVLICMSNTSIKKIGVVHAEIHKAEELQKRRPTGYIFMIPVLLESCPVPDGLKRYHWLDASQPGSIDKLIQSLSTLRDLK